MEQGAKKPVETVESEQEWWAEDRLLSSSGPVEGEVGGEELL